MGSKSDIVLFDTSGNLTTEAIHSFKSGKLKESQVNEVKSFLETSPMDAEAVEAYDPSQQDRFTKLNVRISTKIEKKAGVLESESNIIWSKVIGVTIGILVLGVIGSYFLFFSSSNLANESESELIVENKEHTSKYSAQIVSDTLAQRGTENSKEENDQVEVENQSNRMTPPEGSENEAGLMPNNVNTISNAEAETETIPSQKVLNIVFSINSEYVFHRSIDDTSTFSPTVSTENIDQSEKVLMQYLKDNIEVLPDMLKGGNASYSMSLKNDGSIQNIQPIKKFSTTVDNQMKYLLKDAPVSEFALEDGELRYTIQVNF